MNDRTDRELLKAYADILEELRARAVVRSSNNPVADYTEGLCLRAFGWKTTAKSNKGYDATDDTGRRFEIKGRRLTSHNKSRQMSAIRGLPDRHFDSLAAVLFACDFEVQRAALVPHAVVTANSKFVHQTNSWRFLLLDSIWDAPGVTDITNQLRKAQS